jgi:hypothetical protein
VPLVVKALSDGASGVPDDSESMTQSCCSWSPDGVLPDLFPLVAIASQE